MSRLIDLPNRGSPNLGMEGAYLVSFGSWRYSVARYRLKQQALRSQVFDEVLVYRLGDLPRDFRAKHRALLSHRNRGFGYWVWKPRVIAQALSVMPARSILVYLDVGCHINESQSKGFERYFAQVRESKSGILCSELPFVESQWSKGDVLDFLSVRNDAEVTRSPQRQAGVLFFQKRPTVVEFVQRWLEICENYPSLIDDSPSKSPNSDGFVEHRHDQSIFSILSKSEGVETFSSFELEQWEEPETKRLQGMFPIEVRRNRGPSLGSLRRGILQSLGANYPRERR